MVKIQSSSVLRKLISKERSSLKEISLNSYITSLRSLYKRMFPKDDLSKELDTKFIRDKENVMKDVDNQNKITSKKNILTAILVSLSSDAPKDQELIDFYQVKLKDLSDKYNKFLDTQTKTDTQKNNWISYDDFIEIINKILSEIKQNGITKKETLTRSEYSLLQKFVILSLYQQFSFRNDFASMKVLSDKEYSEIPENIKSINNYMIRDGSKFTIKLNNFKNVARIGVKSFLVPVKLCSILKLFLKFNKSGYLLTLNNARDPLSANGITKVLNSIFSKYADGKKISSSMLRHLTISYKLQGQPSILEEKEKEKETEDTYLHSSAMNERYRKID